MVMIINHTVSLLTVHCNQWKYSKLNNVRYYTTNAALIDTCTLYMHVYMYMYMYMITSLILIEDLQMKLVIKL